MNKLYLKLLILPCVIIITLFTSCKKEKTREELLKGDYSLEFASIDGMDVTGLLINDSVNLFRLYTAEVEDDHPFIFYFRPFNEKQYEFFSSFDFIDDIKLSIHNISWNGNSIVILDKNPAFLAFTKQDQLILNIETLTENQCVFNTVYLGKTYRYKFKE